MVSCFQIHRKMREIMINQPSSCDLKGLAVKFIPEMIGREIEKHRPVYTHCKMFSFVK